METIVIACNLPHGLCITQPGQPDININGANHRSAREAGGFGITEGVDKDSFDAWVSLNSKFPPLVNGSILMQPTRARAEDAGEEREGDVMTGFERIDPENPGTTGVKPLVGDGTAYEGRKPQPGDED